MTHSKSVTKAILLVAGLGTRLRPLTETTPKCLLEVGGSSLIVRFLRQLAHCGVQQAYVVTGYMEEAIVAAVEGLDDLPHIVFVHNNEFERYGNAFSVKLALEAILRDQLLTDTDSVLIADGDVLLRNDDVIRGLISDPNPNVFAIDRRDNLGLEEMKIVLDDHNRVTALSKKLDPATAVGESMGVQCFNGSTVKHFLSEMDALGQMQLVSYYYEDIVALSSDVLNQFTVVDVPPHSFIEIDTVEDLQEARELAATW